MIKKTLITLAVALAAVPAAGAKQQSHKATTLVGAGSTFVQPLVSTWTPAVGSAFDYTVQYSGVGSGAGIAAITSRTVDFGASDAPLTPDQLDACNGCVQIPWALAGTAIPYNIPNLQLPKNTNLHLSGDVLARIYLGQITNWSDRAIKALNPKATIPDLKITPVYRTGNSGTTYNFTDYLSSVSGEWKSKIGAGQAVNWPAGTGASGSAGVAGVVANTPGAICYVDTAFALSSHLRFAAIRIAAGYFVSPSIRNVAGAGDAVK
jgi:phosphate transport system substrate-binding protein